MFPFSSQPKNQKNPPNHLITVSRQIVVYLAPHPHLSFSNMASRFRRRRRFRRRYRPIRRRNGFRRPFVKRRKKSKVSQLIRLPVPFPPKAKVTFHYSDAQHLTPSIGGVGIFQLRLADCYDPQYSIGGGQPRYFDQLVNSDMYRLGLVYKTYYRVAIYNNLNSTSPVNCGVRWDPVSVLPISNFSTSQNVVDSQELPNVRNKIIMNNANSRSVAILKGQIRPWKISTNSWVDFKTNVGFKFSYSNSSVDSPILTIYASNHPQGVGSAMDIAVTFDIWYKCLLYRRGNEDPS